MKLVIFADYGLDDACATAYILNNRAEYESIDIIPIGGNVESGRALANARKLLGAARADGIDTSGVRLVDSTAFSQPFCRLPSVHGNDGIGDILPNLFSCPVPSIEYTEFLKELAGEYRILSLGPATMVVHMLGNAKVMPCRPTVIMGGCTREEPNYNGREFNDALDMSAFEKLLGYNHVAATLDTCRHEKFNYINRHFDGTRLFGKLVNRSIELAAARHNDRCYIYDLIAAYALITPEEFEVKTAGTVHELHYTGK